MKISIIFKRYKHLNKLKIYNIYFLGAVLGAVLGARLIQSRRVSSVQKRVFFFSRHLCVLSKKEQNKRVATLSTAALPFFLSSIISSSSSSISIYSCVLSYIEVLFAIPTIILFFYIVL